MNDRTYTIDLMASDEEIDRQLAEMFAQMEEDGIIARAAVEEQGVGE